MKTLASVLMFALATTIANAAEEARIELPSRPVWAGEVFDLSFDLRIPKDAFRNLEGTPSWDSGALVATPWSRPAILSDGNVTVTRFTASALALRSGTITLTPASHAVVMQTGVEQAQDSERAITQSVVLRSAPTKLSVQALPPAPMDFSGAVGQFELTSSLDAGEPKVGEPLLWRVTLKGRGNWPHIRGLPPRAAPQSFDVAGAPQLKVSGAGIFEHELQEAIALVPRTAGAFSLGPAEVVVFDPVKGEYVRLAAPAISVTVMPGSGGQTAVPAMTDADEVPAAAESATPEPKPFLVPPALEGVGLASAPMSSQTWRTFMLAPLIPLAIFWFGVVWLRALRDDPVRAARLVRRRLDATVSRFAQAASIDQRRALLRSWEKLTARLVGRREAAPVAASFESDSTLLRLWNEADLSLYGRTGALPSDWAQRARDWCSAQPLPTRKPQPVAQKLRRFLPPAAALILGFSGVLGLANAAAPDKGSPMANPLDWIAHYNLAREHITGNRFEEAAAQAAVAWLQRPRERETRVLWAQLADRAEFARQEIGGVVRPFGLRAPAVATLATSAAWRTMGIAMAVLLCVGIGSYLLNRYRFAPAPARRVGIGLALAATAGLALAVPCALTYGLAAEPNAVLVTRAASLRSVPVESITLEQRPPLRSGVLALADKRFLGWLHLRLSDGRTGWLREEQIVWVWSPMH